MADTISDLMARHPCPPGYMPVKTQLGELIDRYGVGSIPIEELHRINTVTPAQMAALRAKADADARAAVARTHDFDRIEQMAAEWEASHGRM